MSKLNVENAAELGDETPCVLGRKKVKRMAGVLHTSKVTHVSLVTHAANGLPFGILKSEDGAVESPQTVSLMSKQAGIPTFGEGTQPQRIEFDISLFKDEKAVQSYLTDSSISGGRIEKTADKIIFHGVHEDSFEVIEPVKGDRDGVTYFVGKLKAPLTASIKPTSTQAKTTTLPIAKSAEGRVRDDDDDTGAAGAEGAEGEAAGTGEAGAEGTGEAGTVEVELDAPLVDVVTKMDEWIARRTGTQTFDATMATGDVELPGLYTISEAIGVTVRNIIRVSPADQVDALIVATYTRAGEIVAKLAGIFTSVQKSEDKEVRTLDRVGCAEKIFSSPPAAPAVAGVVEKTDEPQTPAPGAEAATGEEGAGTGEEATSEFAREVAKAVALVVAPLAAKLEAVEKAADTTSFERRLIPLEGIQIRKSEPDDGEQADAKTEEQKAQDVSKAEREIRVQKEVKANAKFKERQRNDAFGMS